MTQDIANTSVASVQIIKAEKWHTKVNLGFEKCDFFRHLIVELISCHIYKYVLAGYCSASPFDVSKLTT